MRMQRQPREGIGHHLGVQVAALAGVDLDGRGAGGADAVGVVRRLLVAFDHRHRQAGGAGLQRLQRGAQQGGLARAGAGDEVVGHHAMALEMGPVLRGQAVVLAQHGGLDLDGAGLAHAGHRDRALPAP
jgi:hypothetical protein